MTTSNTKRTTLFINSSILKQARAQAILQDLTLTSFVEQALIQYLPKETIIKKVDIGEDVKKNGRISKRNSNHDRR
jgi:hypothetical protein